MAKRIASERAVVLLDIASGTGDIPLRVLRQRSKIRGAGDVTLWVTDLCPQMLEMAKRKLADDPSIRFGRMDAHDLLEIADASVDLVSISFGMKICDRRRVVAQAFRVLKPGGAFYCLEAARIPFAPLHWLYLKYMDWCLPFIAWVAVNDASAYDYLLRGIHDFPDQRTFVSELREAGFVDVGYENLTLGIVALHRGRKP